MAEAALALCTADPSTLTGQVTYSLDLLDRLGRPVHDLTGRLVLDEWAPGTLGERIEKMAAHSRGEIGGGPSNVDALPARRADD